MVAVTRFFTFTAGFGLFAWLSLGAFAQSGSESLAVLEVQPNFYMISGAGGNIAVQVGIDGVLLVDAGSAGMSDQVLAAIRKLSPLPVRFVIDTCADADHVGGNEKLAHSPGAAPPGSGAAAEAGGAIIVSSENVLNRMSAPSGKQAAYPLAAWPTETFFVKQKPLYFNHEGIQVIAEPAAHSDADSIVFFRRSDVIVAGEIINPARFPVIDVGHGGSIQKEIDALNQIIELAIPSIPMMWQEGGTYVIPGHGWVLDQADVVEYRDMVTIIRDVIQDMIHKKMTLEQIKAANPTQGYRKQYGSESGPWTTDMFVEAVYKSLTAAH